MTSFKMADENLINIVTPRVLRTLLCMVVNGKSISGPCCAYVGRPLIAMPQLIWAEVRNLGHKKSIKFLHVPTRLISTLAHALLWFHPSDYKCNIYSVSWINVLFAWFCIHTTNIFIYNLIDIKLLMSAKLIHKSEFDTIANFLRCDNVVD